MVKWGRLPVLAVFEDPQLPLRQLPSSIHHGDWKKNDLHTFPDTPWVVPPSEDSPCGATHIPGEESESGTAGALKGPAILFSLQMSQIRRKKKKKNLPVFSPLLTQLTGLEMCSYTMFAREALGLPVPEVEPKSSC